MELRLFGEVQLRAEGQVLDVGTPRQQLVLAALVADTGRPVPIETLVDRVWGDNPPEQARNVLYSHLSRIRQLATITRRNAGYVLEIDPDEVDLHRLTRLVERGKDTRLPDVDRAAALTEALRICESVPLAGLTGTWVEEVRATWNRRRLDAAVQWGDLQLRLGEPDLVIDTLADLVGVYPLAEPLEVLLLQALHATGRDAEAIGRYAAVRQRLADQLGTDPGPELQALHSSMLRGELPATRRSAPVSIPAQLPADTPGFAGRAVELRRLDSLLDPAATPIAVLSGTAGVGKTTLAVHWAHTVRGAFADGQFYVNLRGFDPAGPPVTAAEALRGFLEALEVQPNRIPTTIEAQAGLYRSLLAGRRVLVVLDNARDAEQVRPLLPGAPGCLVLVTSRNQLTGLTAAGAHPIGVDLLDDDESHAMLRARLGTARIATEAATVEEIISLCARLPLALAVVAARAATHPNFSLAVLAGQLRDARGSLDEFAGSDPATDPRAVFSWSYLGLTPPAARLFRLLGLHPGPDIGTHAAASLAALPASKLRPVLAELTQAHLVDEPAPGRYTCHDLLRAYASELLESTEPLDEREAAVRRLLGHYSHTAYHADGFLDPRREVPPTLTPLPAGAESEPILDHAYAFKWFKTEHRVLLTALRLGGELDAQVWELAWSIRRFLAVQGHWHDELAVLTVALTAARRLGDGRKQAFAQCYLGCNHVWFGRYAEADTDLQVALTLYRAADDSVGMAYVHHYFAWLRDRQGDIPGALEHSAQALDLFSAAGHQAGQAKALNALGWFHTLLGEHAIAIEYCEQALDLQTRLGDHLSAAQTWDTLGKVHKELGDNAQAITCYEAAAELFHRNGYLIAEARVLTELAGIRVDMGDTESARAGWQQANDILAQLAHPEADEVRARLARVHSRQSGNEEETHG